MTNATNVLIIIDTICILAVTFKIFTGKDGGYKRGVKDGIKYSLMFIQDTIAYANKNSDQDTDE